MVPVWKLSLLASAEPPVSVPPASTSEFVTARLLRSRVPPASVMVLVPKAATSPATSVPELTRVAPV